jgi:hypothetical protein
MALTYLEEAIRYRLVNTAAVAALLSSRVYFVKMPQNPVMPCATLNLITARRDYAQEGQTALVNSLVQVDAWAESESGVKGLAEQIRLALSGYRGILDGINIQGVFLVGDTPMYEIDTLLWRVMHQYRVWSQETVPS